MRNVSINVTLPNAVISYIDEKAQSMYVSRATITRQLIMEHVEELKVVETRKKGFSIRKVAEITGIGYDKVLDILRRSGIEEDNDKELEEYIGQVQRKLLKRQRSADA